MPANSINFQTFHEIWLDSDSEEEYLYRCFGVLHNYCADEIIVEDYFKVKFKEACENPETFDEEYFANPKRRQMFVLFSAVSDPEIFELLNNILLRTLQPLYTKETLLEDLIKLRKEVQF